MIRETPLVCRPFTKSGPAASPTTATKPVSPSNSKIHQRRRGNAADHGSHRMEPAPEQTSEQHADTQGQSKFQFAEGQRRDPDQSADDDTGGDEHHVGRFSRPVRHTDGADRIFDMLLTAGQA